MVNRDPIKRAKWYQVNKEKIKLKKRKNRLKTRYGISLFEYENLLIDQDHKCAICKKPESRILLNKICPLSVDHCHITGKIRGLLCSNCNVAIGKFKDSIENLESAIRYLKSNS